MKWGKVTGTMKREKTRRLPGFYTDGKRSPTLVRRTKVTKVATGKRGQVATRDVTTASNEVETLDH